MLPKIEDALRCASLPDEGSRVLVVRRLDLGRIPAEISASELSRLIEARVAATGQHWIMGGTPAAMQADCVVFASALEARVQLAVHLARGEPCREWYWQPAVREYLPVFGVAENLRRMAGLIAQWPEARTALPAWIAAIVEAKQATVLVAALGEAYGQALVQRVGIPALDEAEIPALSLAPLLRILRKSGVPVHEMPEHETAQFIAQLNARRWPRWLLAALHAAGRELPANPEWTRVLRLQVQGDAAATERESGSLAQAQNLEVTRSHTSGEHAELRDKPRRETPVFAQAFGEVRDDVPVEVSSLEAASAKEMPAEISNTKSYPALAETQRGGLLFLLPVLARLGLPDWCAQHDIDSAEFARRILQLALTRLHTMDEDPAHAITTRSQAEICEPCTAPENWQHPQLVAPRARAHHDLTQALTVAVTRSAQALVWLTAARRLLRRAAGIGIASLIARPARLSMTPTHIDVHFLIDDTDLRVRRAGLDSNPGWLPWFGRVVQYHYRERMA